MSYNIYVEDKQGNIVQLEEPHHFKGGTYAVNGTINAHLNITYNYSQFYREIWENGLRGLNELELVEAVKEIEEGLEYLGTTEQSDDYWESTKGNAGHALFQLLQICRLVKKPEDKILAVY